MIPDNSIKAIVSFSVDSIIDASIYSSENLADDNLPYQIWLFDNKVPKAYGGIQHAGSYANLDEVYLTLSSFHSSAFVYSLFQIECLFIERKKINDLRQSFLKKKSFKMTFADYIKKYYKEDNSSDEEEELFDEEYEDNEDDFYDDNEDEEYEDDEEDEVEVKKPKKVKKPSKKKAKKKVPKKQSTKDEHLDKNISPFRKNIHIDLD